MIWILLGVAGGILLLCILAALVCFFLVFYSPTRKVLKDDEYDLPAGKIYEPHREAMIGWVRMTRDMPCQEVSITSFDGLTLRGRYFECNPGAPVELLFNGYRGNAERDLSGGVARCFALGRNALLIDQRASGRSDGHIITFGIRERRDCLDWANFASSHFGKHVKLILTGISMGAATVMMASCEPLPENVVCILADCGYTSPREIIQKVTKDIHLPPKLLYALIRLSAMLFGRFDLDDSSALEAVSRCQVPLILIHGEDDDFVPCEMSRRLYDICASSNKKFVAVPGAGHGLAYPVDPEGYLAALSGFQQECGF